jgi:hypothetical protein
LAVAVAGIAAGMINTVVGSGTLITFPVLLAVGLPPLTANVSNGLGLVPGSLFGAIGYRDELSGQAPRLRRLGSASVIGALGGAILLLVLPPGAFNAIVPALIVIALVLVVVQPRLARRLAARRAAEAAAAEAKGEQVAPRTDGWLLWAGTLATGVYGGYFGAAQGVLLIGLLATLSGEPSMQRNNAVKNVLTTTANLAAAVLFICSHPVDWAVAGLIAGGSTVGGLLGGRYGRRLPPSALRALIVLIGVVAIVRML